MAKATSSRHGAAGGAHVSTSKAQPKKGRGQKAKVFNLHEHIAELQRQMGTHTSAKGQGPGDVAWRGPCENGTQMVCRFDQDMQPSNCAPEPCAPKG